MERLVKAAWAALALVHVAPAAVLAAPHLVRGLYGIEATGDLGVLIVHRGALFLAIVVLCVAAFVDAGARRAASLAVGISVVAFLVLYGLAGAPAGPLRTIAIADAVVLPALLLVLADAWRRRAALR